MLSPVKSALNYQPTQLIQKNVDTKDAYKNTLEAINAGVDLLPKAEIKADDAKHIVNFLKTLTDPCVKDRACMSRWIPKIGDNDPDGLMLHAIDARTGKIL
jgi:cytochrome c peroxidase